MIKKLDVLFVNANGAPIIYQELANEFSAIEPPIWAAMLAKHVKIKGFSVDILDCEALQLTVEDSLEQIKIRNPKLVVMVLYGQQPSASIQNMTGASLLCSALKYDNADIKIMMLGLYPSACSNDVMINEKCDFVCQGEGPYTIVGLLQTDLKSVEQLEKVPGLWFKKGIFVRSNSYHSVIEQPELHNELPGMAWDLLPMNKYRTSNWHSLTNGNIKTPFASLYTSLGCVYSCEFCCINAPFGNNNIRDVNGRPSFRYWDPNFIITEFDKIAKMGIKNVKIADEMFVLYPKHYSEICKLIIERGYDFNLWVYSRINTVKDGYLNLMKKAGINWLALGIEAGSEEVRKGVIKGSFKDVNIVQTVKKIQNEGINVIGNFIFGLPDDNIETMQQTLDLAKELNCEFANFYSCMCYPGSTLYLEAVKNNYDLPKTYSGYSQHSYDCYPSHTKHLTNKEVLRFRDQAFIDYYNNESYLNTIRFKFGEKCVDNIKEMCNIKLKRKLLGH